MVLVTIALEFGGLALYLLTNRAAENDWRDL
jgi:hypothetical protein